MCSPPFTTSTMTEHTLPDNDRDLVLARKVGDLLHSGKPISVIDDPLVDKLVKYRKRVHQAAETGGKHKELLWKRISKQTLADRDETPVRPLRGGKRASWRIWAAAASFLVIALAGALYFTMFTGSELVAESGQSATTVTLADGSSITLRPHSQLYRLEDNNTSQLYQLTGEGLFEVSNNPNRTFAVQSDKGKVSVLGTKFLVSTWGDVTKVYLETGSVRIENLDNDESVILKPGEYASITKNNELTTPRKAERVLFTDWLRNELVFRNQSPEEVFAEIEQHYDISIQVTDNISTRKISGSLVLDSLMQSLNDLELVIGGRFSNSGENKYRFIPDK